MEVEFFFRVDIDESKHKKVSSILELLATRDTPYWELSSTKIQEIELFIQNFIDKLESNKESLNDIGLCIQEDVSFWYLNEYDDQCNIDLSHTFLKLLGNAGISLSLSCWKKNDTIEYS